MTDHIMIGSTPYTPIINSLKIERAIGKASISSPCTFDLYDPGGNWLFRQGQPVQVIADVGGTIFGGYIDSVITTLLTPKGSVKHNITCRGMDYLAQKRIITAELKNMNPVMMTKQVCLKYLAAEGVTYTSASIPDICHYWGDGSKFGPATLFQEDNVINVSFKSKSVAEALDSLADLTGRYWYISPSKTLYFLPTDSVPAPFTLQSTMILYSENPTVRRNGDQYRNCQYMFDSKALKHMVDDFHGNGTNTMFSLSMPCNSVPKITVNGVRLLPSQIGIQGIDTNRQFYWNKGSNMITQDNTSNPLYENCLLTVEYNGEYTITSKVLLEDEQANRAALEGTSGIVECYLTNDTPMNAEDAEDFNRCTMMTYAQDTIVFQFKTMRPGLSEGQWLQMNIPELQLTNPMLITNFSSEEHGKTDTGEIYYYNITTVTGPLQMAWPLILGG